MATKLKKSKSYQLKWKVLVTILLFLCAISIFFCGVVAANISKRWSGDVVYTDEFYDTEEFYVLFSDLVDRAVQASIYYQNEARIAAGEAVDRQELIGDFKRYYGIIDGVITGNTEIKDTYDGLLIYGNIPESLHENLKEYQYLVESRLPLYYKMYIQKQLDDYKNCQRQLESAKNFLYYVEDENGNVIDGNALRGELGEQERTIVLSSGFSSNRLGDNQYYFSTYTNPILEKSGYKVFAAIRDPLQPGDEFYDLWQEFGFVKHSFPILFIGSVISLILLLCCLVYLMRVTGQKEKGGAVQYYLVDHIYNEIHLALVCAFYFFALGGGFALFEIILSGTVVFWNYVFITILCVLYLAVVAVSVSYLLSIARQVKGKRFIRNTWISVTIRRVTALFTGTTFRGWMVIVMLCYGLGNCVVMGVMILAPYYNGWKLSALAGVGLLLFNVLCIYLFIRALRSLKYIMISARETSKGNFSYQLDLSRISPSFLNFAEDVANIQDGLKNAVDDAVKGERMKAELITNVSHDLKTPLTSIISYADLLKKEKLSNETAKGYVNVLYEKSYRLKQLIEDLIEASKASSGNLTVTKMRIDYRQLTLQAMGEMEEKTEAAGLTFKLSCPEPVFIDADGRHMWRILENLLSNVVKYSMPHSRVYVDIFKMDGFGILVMKNISASPIDFDETRLTERFVRGDESRTTEGAGLGLSITQSLTEIQDGTFGIQVDGDLFKAIVSLPLWEKDEESAPLSQGEETEEFQEAETA